MDQAVAYSTLALTVTLAVSQPRLGRPSLRVTPGMAALVERREAREELPLALRQRPGILWENKRCLTRVKTFTLGEVLYLEIGATCVGTIVHTAGTQTVRKGDEKGYFRFGGSCVITIYEPGRLRLDEDLLPHARNFTEVYAWMGERVGEVGA